jgi:hypothetical protein
LLIEHEAEEFAASVISLAEIYVGAARANRMTVIPAGTSIRSAAGPQSEMGVDGDDAWARDRKDWESWM